MEVLIGTRDAGPVGGYEIKRSVSRCSGGALRRCARYSPTGVVNVHLFAGGLPFASSALEELRSLDSARLALQSEEQGFSVGIERILAL